MGYGWWFFLQAEDGIRDLTVTGVQTCALPIFRGGDRSVEAHEQAVPRRVRSPARRGDRRPRAGRAILRDDGARLPHRDGRGRPIPVRAESVRPRRRALRDVRKEARHDAHDRPPGDDVLLEVPALAADRAGTTNLMIRY